MTTDRLIEQLAQDLRPAPAQRAPRARAGWWLVGTIIYLGILGLMKTSRADVAFNDIAWRFVIPQFAAIVTAAASATAAFASTVPGSSRRILILPAITTMVWLVSVAGGAVQEWIHVGGASVVAPDEWLCVAIILLGGAPPSLAMALMLRQGAPLTPRLTAALGVLSVTVLANVVACISSPHPSSGVTLVWHGGTILAAIVLAAWGSHLVLNWEKRRQLAHDGA